MTAYNYDECSYCGDTSGLRRYDAKGSAYCAACGHLFVSQGSLHEMRDICETSSYFRVFIRDNELCCAHFNWYEETSSYDFYTDQQFDSREAGQAFIAAEIEKGIKLLPIILKRLGLNK